MAESNKHRKPEITDAQRRKDELIAELARSRSGMALHADQVKYQADVGRRVKTSFRHHVGLWLTGAVVTGGAISMLPMREKKVYVSPLSKKAKEIAKDIENPRKPGFWMALVGLLLPILRPILTKFVTKQLSGYLESTTAAKTGSANPDAAAASA